MSGAGSAAVALVYRSIIIRGFQPATSINSFSLPPSASKLMGMHSRKPRGPGPVVHDLVDARGSHGSIAPDPEVRQVRKSMLLAYPQIAVQGLSGRQRTAHECCASGMVPHIRVS
jgi:hypothetical protein